MGLQRHAAPCTAAPLTAPRLLVVSSGEQNNTLSSANNYNIKFFLFEDISHSEELYNMSLKCLSNLTVDQCPEFSGANLISIIIG